LLHDIKEAIILGSADIQTSSEHAAKTNRQSYKPTPVRMTFISIVSHRLWAIYIIIKHIVLVHNCCAIELILTNSMRYVIRH